MEIQVQLCLKTAFEQRLFAQFCAAISQENTNTPGATGQGAVSPSPVATPVRASATAEDHGTFGESTIPDAPLQDTKPKRAKKDKAPTEEPKAETPPAAATAPADSFGLAASVTFEKIRGRLSAASVGGKAAQVRAFLFDRKYNKLSDIPADKYGEIWDAIVEAGL